MSTANKLYNHISGKEKFKSVNQNNPKLLSQWAENNLNDLSAEKIVQNIPHLFTDITNLFDEFGVSGLLWNTQCVPITNGVASSAVELNDEQIEKMEYLIHNSSNFAKLQNDHKDFKPLFLGIKSIAIPCGFTAADIYEYVIHYRGNNVIKKKMLNFKTNEKNKIIDKYIETLRNDFKKEIPFRKHQSCLPRNSSHDFSDVYAANVNLKKAYLQRVIESMDDTAVNINQFERWLNITQKFVNEKCELWNYDLNVFLCDYFKYYCLMFDCLQEDKYFLSNVLNAWFYNNLCVMNSICNGISIAKANYVWQKLNWKKGTVSMLQTHVVPLLPIIWLQKFATFVQDWSNNNVTFSQIQCFQLIHDYMQQKYMDCEWDDYNRGTYINSNLKSRPNVKPTTCYSSLMAEHYDLFLYCKWIGSGTKIKFLEIVHTFVVLAVPSLFSIFIKYLSNLVDGKQYASPTCEQCINQNDIEIITVSKKIHCFHEISKAAPQSAIILRNLNENNLWKHVCHDILAPINILLQITNDLTSVQNLLQKLIDHEIEWNHFEKTMQEMVQIQVFHSLWQCYNDTKTWQYIWKKLHLSLPHTNDDFSDYDTNSKHGLLIANLKSWEFHEKSIQKYHDTIKKFINNENIENQSFNMQFMIDLFNLLQDTADNTFLQCSLNFNNILPLCNPHTKSSKNYHKGSNSSNIGFGLRRQIDLQSPNLKGVSSAIEQCGMNLASYLGFTYENTHDDSISISKKMKNNHKTTAHIKQTKSGICSVRDINICKTKEDVCDFCIKDNKCNIFVFFDVDLLDSVDMVIESLQNEINDIYLKKIENSWNSNINLNDERLLAYFDTQSSLDEIGTIGAVLMLPIFVSADVEKLLKVTVDCQRLTQMCDKINSYLHNVFTNYTFDHIFFVKNQLINGSGCCLLSFANFHKCDYLIGDIFQNDIKFWGKWVNTWFSQVIQIGSKCAKPTMGMMNKSNKVVYDLSLVSHPNHPNFYYNVLAWLLILNQL